MLKSQLFWIFFISVLTLYGQNLVPNGGFEHVHKEAYSMMDSGHEFGRAVKNWETPNLASTDLVGKRFRTPKFKPIPAHSGNNMAGLVIHGDFWSEYVKVKLKDTLQIGAEYYVEFWTAYCRDYHKDNQPRFLNPYFGALVDNNFFIKTDKVINKKPHVFSPNPVELIPNEWVKITGKFKATTEATHLYIGQFFDPTVNNPILMGYYYIDDVRLERFSDVSTVFTPKESAPDGLNNIYFETDKYDLIGRSFETLDKIVLYLERNPSLTIKIFGHTDNEGEFYHNQELSDNRAKSVYNYLVNKGINPKRLTSKGFGSNQPIATNNTEIGRQENRRVEFLASNALVSNTSLDNMNVAESDLVYIFSSENNSPTLTQKQKIGLFHTWTCNTNQTKRSPDKAAQKQLSEYIKKDATPYLLNRTTNEQIVIFNDSQEHPQTRAYFTSLLQDFYNQGFRNLGVEGLGYLDKSMNERGYPSINSGDRTDEPIYGEMLRVALNIGFKVFPYQAKPEEITKAKNIVKRSPTLSKDEHNVGLSAKYWAQAMNINRHLQQNSGEKILIYAHQQHHREQDIEGVRFMGAWLKQFTKINPFTIEQAQMNERCFDNEYPLYYTANVSSPTIFARDQKVLIMAEQDSYSNEAKSSYDLQIYHPRTTYNNRRPTWMNPLNDKKIKTINLDKYQMKLPCLVMAYYENEDTEIAIPADIKEAKNGDRSPTLLLKEGNYTLILRDRDKRKKLDISVP